MMVVCNLEFFNLMIIEVVVMKVGFKMNLINIFIVVFFIL